MTDTQIVKNLVGLEKEVDILDGYKHFCYNMDFY